MTKKYLKRNAPAPEGLDLTLPVTQIYAKHGYYPAMVHRWRKEAGIVIKTGPPKVGPAHSIAHYSGLVTDEDWAKGFKHVGQKLGVSRARAQQVAVLLGKQSGLRRGGQPHTKDRE